MRARLNIPDQILDESPTYELPTGPVWQRRAHELLEGHEQDVARYLVRCLDHAPSALVASAVLRHSTGLEHPRCWSPNFWTRHQGRLFIATIRPLGEPLSAASLREDRSWSEVVELWRPLAEAIRRAHQRGVVHGQLTPWTVWYDAEAERLTAIDAGCWVGDALPTEEAALQMIAPELRRPSVERSPDPLCDIYGLASLLAQLARHDTPQSLVPAFAQAALERALHPDPNARLVFIDELIAATTHALEATPEEIDALGEAEITTVREARITHTEAITHPRLGSGTKFYLNFRPGAHPPGSPLHSQDETEGRLGAFFYEESDRGLFDSLRWSWDGAMLNLIDARLITDSRGRRFVTSHNETLPVLEPNFPVSVSNVLKAERCTSRFLVDERDAGSSTRALVLGNLVHGLLEDLTSPDPPSFSECFEARVAKSRLELLAAGLTEPDMEPLERDARQHYQNLERFTRQRRANGEEAPRALLAPTPRWPSEESVYDKEPHHDLGWSGRHIEVTRYSPLYGLEGRIDLATQDEREGVQIIELKSGSAWDGHLSQVRCYTLLWDGLARSQQMEVSGYVLYSRYGRLNAVPMEDISRERRILRARNELVACQRSFVDPSFDYTPPHFMQEPRNCQAPSCKFRRDRCKAQTEDLGLDPEVSAQQATQLVWRGFEPELVEIAWAYWKHYDRMIEMERWSQQSALGKLFQTHRLQERIDEHHACEGMRLSHVDLERNRLTFTGRGAHIFSPKAAVLIHKGDLHADHTIQGYVIESGPDFVTLSSQGAPGALDLDPHHWIIDLLPTRIGVRHAKQALYTIMSRKPKALLRALLTPKEAGELFRPDEALRQRAELARQQAELPIRPRHAYTPPLNARQREACDVALHSPLGALIQGPPGTGKTTVIAQIVRELVLRNERVLVCAQTNTAVDTLLTKVLDAGIHAFLRVGDPERSPQLTLSLELAGCQDPALFFTRSLAEHTPNLNDLSAALTECRVFGATTHAAVRDPIFEFLSKQIGDPIFDVVIVDEASQLTEPMTLAAIKHARRFVLVGDHRQLPPIVQSEQALSAYYHSPFEAELDDAEWLSMSAEQLEQARHDHTAEGGERPRTFSLDPRLQEIGCAGLDRSLFERLITQLPHVMLEEQYRMNEAIMSYSNRAFYKGKLYAHPDIAAHRLTYHPEQYSRIEEPWRAILSADHPVSFVHIDGEDIGRTNHAEAEALVESVAQLLGDELFLTGEHYGPKPSIGVISPFRAQGQLIRELMISRLGDRAWMIDVDTVERYQGGERDIILVSLVKTERAGDFLSDMRRLNVTLTRARKKIVIFGNRPCLELNARLRALIEQPETAQFSL